MAEADSVDRAFAQALHTVRRLPRPRSARPPPHVRLRLYGLYKQAMEGDVEAVLRRPPDIIASASASASTSTASVEDDQGRFQGSHLGRERKVRDEIQKWEAWHACAGIGRTEAKRRYIEQLIQAMKMYAAGTAETKESVEELEFVWNQIRSQTGNEESLGNTACAEALGSGHDSSNPVGAGGGGDDGGSRLRLLSPMSGDAGGGIIKGDCGSISEREMLQPDHREEHNDDDDDDDDDGQGKDDQAEEAFGDAPDGSTDQDQNHPIDRRRSSRQPPAPSTDTLKWRHQVETALTKMSIELAALREQMDELNLHHSRFQCRRSWTGCLGFGFDVGSRGSGRGRRSRFRILASRLRYFSCLALRQVLVNLAVLALLLLWGVWARDERFERWVRRRWGQLRRWVEGWKHMRKVVVAAAGTRRGWGFGWLAWMMGILLPRSPLSLPLSAFELPAAGSRLLTRHNSTPRC